MSEELSIIERVQLLDILPQEGDITTLRIISDLRRELSFSEQEIAETNIKVETNQVTWNQSVIQSKSIDIGPKALALIVETLNKLSASKQLHLAKLPLYERFVEGKGVTQ